MRWTASLLLLTALLSGCTEPTDDPGPEPEPDPLDTGPTPDPMPDANLTARLGLDATAGTAPLDVTFSIDAPGALDPGNVSWSLTAVRDGNESLLDGGLGVPATATHTFPAGDHTLRLEVVEDGVSAVETVQVVVDAAPDAGEAENGTDLATVHRLAGSFAQGTADPTFGPVPSPGTGPVSMLEFEVPHDAAAVHLWVDWDDGETGNSPLLTDLDVALYDAAGTLVADPATATFEYAYAEGTFAAGTWRLELLPYAVPTDTQYAVEVLAWATVPEQTTFTGTGGGVELGTPADAAPDVHALDLPAGTQTVAARLEWSTEGLDGCAREDAYPNDYDFEALLGTDVRFGRGSFASCEFGATDAAADEDLGGAWSLVVHKFLTTPSDYALTVFHT